MPGFVYARWFEGAGAVAPGELDRDALLDEIAADVIERGDMPGALARVTSTGFAMSGAREAGGTRAVIEALRRIKRLKMSSCGQAAMYEHISGKLGEIVKLEKAALEEASRQVATSGDGDDGALLQDSFAARAAFLGSLPGGIDAAMEELAGYELISPEARASFEELRSWLSGQVVESYLGPAAAALAVLDGPGRQRLRECLDAVSSLLEQRRTGGPSDGTPSEGVAGWPEEGAAAGVLERFGDLLPGDPGDPGDLDGVLRRLASRISAVEDLVGSMPEAQCDQLRDLMGKTFADLDLRWQAERMVGNLRRCFPELAWGKSRAMSGPGRLDLVEGTEVMQELAEIEQLEEVLSRVRSPGELLHVDLGKVAELLGPAPASSLQRLTSAARLLFDARLMEVRDGSCRLSPEGMRKVGAGVLADLFASVGGSSMLSRGDHDTGLVSERGAGRRAEPGIEELTRPYEHGDQLSVNLGKTFKNALVRSASRGRTPLAPLEVAAADFEVDTGGDLAGASTVIALDVSLSMPMHGCFGAAKKVAIAVHALVAARYPRDFLGLVAFSDRAREMDPADLVGISWDFVQGTNVQHALAVSRRMLARRRGVRQVLVVTDGEPTAHLEPDGELFFCHPPGARTVDATMREVSRCAADGIVVNTFMVGALAAGTHLAETEAASGDPRAPIPGELVRRLVSSGAGRVMLTDAGDLGRHVLVDFVSGRRGVRQ